MPYANPAILQDPERIESLRVLCLLDSPADPAFDRLTELAAMILDVPVALVSLVDSDRQFFKSHIGLPEPWATQRQTALSHSFCQHVIVHAEPLIIEDARHHPLVYDNLAIVDMNVIAYAGIPILTSDGYAIGSFCIIDHRPRAWTQREIEILTKLAAAVMTEVELRAEMIERKRAEQEREALLARVTELEQIKSDMIRVAAHDLRTPLGLIMGYTTLLDDGTLDEGQADFLKEIMHASTRMETMIRDILSLERIEAMASGQHDTIELGALVQTAFEERQPQAREKAQEYTLLLPETQVMFEGDQVQLHEAIENLIGNAIKYTPRGGTIQVRLSEDGRFEVEDNGYGIPENQQKGIFSPFYRAKSNETAHIQGTGLGLHLVKRIIERHQGTMYFQSEYGKGSLFGFQLPV